MPATAPTNWNIEGQLTIADGEIYGRDNRGKLEQLNAQITFLSQQARIERADFRLGDAQLALNGIMPNLAEPKLDFQLIAPEIDLADLPALAISQPTRLKQLSVKGQVQMQNDSLSVSGDRGSAARKLQRLCRERSSLGFLLVGRRPAF